MMGAKKRGNILLILLSALLICCLGLSLVLSPHASFSETENRELTLFPEIRWENLLDGSFSLRFTRFCADQFPLRSLFVSLSTYAELAMGKGEREGILFGSDGYLIPRGEVSDLSVLSENLNAVRIFSEAAQFPVSVFFVPRHADVLSSLLPANYSDAHSSRVLDTVLAAKASILCPIEEWQGKAEYYYKTDHHWTTDGAYEAYRLLGDSLGYSPMEESYFERVTVSDSFLGTSYSTAGGVSSSSDSVTLYRFPEDDRFRIRYETAEDLEMGFYRSDALNHKDHYAVFLGGNYARLTVTDPAADGEKPRLLLIKDSYANALIPFLSLHFDLTVLDPRYRGSEDFGDLEDYDRVLILQGLNTLCNDSSLQRFLSSP